MVGMILSIYSTTVTSAPKRLYTCPNSKPITPPPITIMCFGISLSFKASVDVMIRSLSSFINGKFDGLLPVAIIVFFASISLVSSPETVICVASLKLPKP